MAKRALVHDAEAHGVTIQFTHAHNQQGYVLNELAENVAKTSAGLSLQWLFVPVASRLVQSYVKRFRMGMFDEFVPVRKNAIWFAVGNWERSFISNGNDAMHAHAC